MNKLELAVQTAKQELADLEATIELYKIQHPIKAEMKYAEFEKKVADKRSAVEAAELALKAFEEAQSKNILAAQKAEEDKLAEAERKGYEKAMEELKKQAEKVKKEEKKSE